MNGNRWQDCGSVTIRITGRNAITGAEVVAVHAVKVRTRIEWRDTTKQPRVAIRPAFLERYTR